MRLSSSRDAVGMDLEEAAAEVERVAVSQMTAVGQAHAQDGVAVLEHGEVGRDVGLGARMRLHVHELGAGEECQGAVLGEALDDVDDTRSHRSSACRAGPRRTCW